MTVANQRTLEQKIADAGPFDQRIDPHVLGAVRNRLTQEGVIAATNRAGAPWFYASNTDPAALCPPARCCKGIVEVVVSDVHHADWHADAKARSPQLLLLRRPVCAET